MRLQSRWQPGLRSYLKALPGTEREQQCRLVSTHAQGRLVLHHMSLSYGCLIIQQLTSPGQVSQERARALKMEAVLFFFFFLIPHLKSDFPSHQLYSVCRKQVSKSHSPFKGADYTAAQQLGMRFIDSNGRRCLPYT